MKKLVLLNLMIFTMGFVSVGCKDKAKEADTVDAMETSQSDDMAQTYTVDADASQIEWKGFKPTGTHNGTIDIENGEINVNDNSIEGGNVTIDMKSITVMDLEGEEKQNLESHLKGTVEGKEGDFFNVNKYPEARFDITGTEMIDTNTTSLSGNLTLKGVTKNVTFPVKVSMDDNSLTITSDTFTIDRTNWNVNYGSKSVFDNLGDSFINDGMELKITVKANKA